MDNRIIHSLEYIEYMWVAKLRNKKATVMNGKSIVITSLLTIRSLNLKDLFSLNYSLKNEGGRDYIN